MACFASGACEIAIAEAIAVVAEGLVAIGLAETAAELLTLSSQGKRNNADQDALIQVAKDADKTGGVTAEEAEILIKWAEELEVPSRGPEVHPDRPHGKEPHIHIGPINHIPVR